MAGSKKFSLSRVLLILAVIIVGLMALKFVFSIAWGVMKFVGLGALGLGVVWLALGNDKKGKTGT